jgi:hypothetical protein
MVLVATVRIVNANTLPLSRPFGQPRQPEYAAAAALLETAKATHAGTVARCRVAWGLDGQP